MPTYTDLPPDIAGHKGELRLARQLQALDDSRYHFWFGARIPGVKDIDVLLYHEEAGAFCIEVKAVELSAVREFTYTHCQIEGRAPDAGPHNQAFKARNFLLDYLHSNHRLRNVNLGYFISTACWPRIRRLDWKRRVDNPAIAKMAESMLFEEDVTSGRQVLIDRLKYIAAHPPSGPGLSYPFRHNAWHLEALKQAMNERGSFSATPSDLEKLRVIEAEVTKQTLSEAPLTNASRCIYSGHPGTGKTFRLLQIGLHHALAGRRVLFACFNKTLATDIRRLLSYSEKLLVADSMIDVYDVYQMINFYDFGNEFAAETAEAIRDAKRNKELGLWAELLVADMKEQNLPVEKYDVVLVDEAQDMENWALEMVDLHTQSQTTICVAAGAGQELYGVEAVWLSSFRKDTKTIKKGLRRNFRNTKPVFQLAQVAYEAKLDPTRSQRVARHIATQYKQGGTAQSGNGSKRQRELDFDREEGRFPAIIFISEASRFSYEQDDDFQRRWSVHMVDEYCRLIGEQLEKLDNDSRPIDVLVLVPNTYGAERTWALQALEKLGVPFMDYMSSFMSL